MCGSNGARVAGAVAIAELEDQHLELASDHPGFQPTTTCSGSMHQLRTRHLVQGIPRSQNNQRCHANKTPATPRLLSATALTRIPVGCRWSQGRTKPTRLWSPHK